MNFKLLIPFLILAFCSSSCNDPNELGGGYYYLPKYESIDVGYPYGSILYKSLAKNSFEEVMIYSNVERVEANKQYILVRQIPDKKIMKKQLIDSESFWRHDYVYRKLIDTLVQFPHGMESLKKLKERDRLNYSGDFFADSLISNVPYYQKLFANRINYWIIDKSKDTLIGPLTKEEYMAKRKELGIPDDLQLDE